MHLFVLHKYKIRTLYKRAGLQLQVILKKLELANQIIIMIVSLHVLSFIYITTRRVPTKRTISENKNPVVYSMNRRTIYLVLYQLRPSAEWFFIHYILNKAAERVELSKPTV